MTRARTPKPPSKSARLNRRLGGPRALAVPVGQITRGTLGRRSLAEAELIAQWASIAGVDLARLCVPRRIVFPDRKVRRDGTLVLACHGAENLRVQHMEPVVLARVNAFFGYPAVVRVRLEPTRSGAVAPTPPQPPRRDLSPEDRQGLGEAGERVTEAVTDEGLRAALRRLARALAESR